MPQLQLPIFPKGVEHLTPELAVMCQDGRVAYFNGQMPVFIHPQGDLKTFRMITSQFVVNGNCRQNDITRVFGVPSVSVKRAVKRYRQQGVEGFYRPRVVRGPAVLTAPVLTELQGLLDEGMDVRVAATQLGLKPDTVHKAVRAQRLHVGKKKTRRPRAAR